MIYIVRDINCYLETKISNKILILGFFLNRLKEKEMLSMAFYDWNHDGNKDFMDDYLEYNIYKSNQ